jgi:hypothetical protein
MSIIIHADVHNDESFAPMWRSLLARADAGEIVLLCDGSQWSMGETHLQRPPDIKWQGTSPYVNGLESPPSELSTWAETVIVVGSCQPVNNTFAECGADGINAIRILCRALLDIDIPVPDSITRFIDGMDADNLDQHDRLKAINNRAVERGRWPAGDWRVHAALPVPYFQAKCRAITLLHPVSR